MLDMFLFGLVWIVLKEGIHCMRDVNEGWIEDKTDCLRREWDSSEPRRQDIGILLLLLHSIYVIPFKGKGGLVPQRVPQAKDTLPKDHTVFI